MFRSERWRKSGHQGENMALPSASRDWACQGDPQSCLGCQEENTRPPGTLWHWAAQHYYGELIYGREREWSASYGQRQIWRGKSHERERENCPPILKKQGCKSALKDTCKLNSIIYKKYFLPQASKLYSKDTKMVPNMQINIIYHTNRLKDKNHKIITVNAEKTNKLKSPEGLGK